MITLSLQRKLFITGAAICFGLIGIALYFQHGLGLEPCPLCIFQRMAFLLLGGVCTIAAIHDPALMGRRIYGGLGLLVAAAGAGIAGRHVWLQNLPADQVPSCGPGLEYMLETFPLFEMLETVFRGSGECAEISWSLLGLTMPAWTLLIFAGFILASLGITIKKNI